MASRKWGYHNKAATQYNNLGSSSLVIRVLALLYTYGGHNYWPRNWDEADIKYEKGQLLETKQLKLADLL